MLRPLKDIITDRPSNHNQYRIVDRFPAFSIIYSPGNNEDWIFKIRIRKNDGLFQLIKFNARFKIYSRASLCEYLCVCVCLWMHMACCVLCVCRRTHLKPLITSFPTPSLAPLIPTSYFPPFAHFLLIPSFTCSFLSPLLITLPPFHFCPHSKQ